MTQTAVLRFEYETEQRAASLRAAISPELGAIDDDRSSVRCERSGDTLELFVEAADPVALRASCNTWLSLVSVAERVGGAESSGCDSQ